MLDRKAHREKNLTVGFHSSWNTQDKAIKTVDFTARFTAATRDVFVKMSRHLKILAPLHNWCIIVCRREGTKETAVDCRLSTVDTSRIYEERFKNPNQISVDFLDTRIQGPSCRLVLV